MSAAHPKRDQGPAAKPGGLPQEKVEDRPNVGTVRPEDYPEQERVEATPVGK
jgi:hypothetical protein